MYSIPLFLLIKDSSIFNPSDIQEHQNFCKLFTKAQGAYESKLEYSKYAKKDNKDKKEKELPSKIWSWFDNLSLEEKIQICTIKNKWLLKILIQLYYIHFLDNKTTFETTNEMNVLFTSYQNFSPLSKNIQIFPNYKDTKKQFGYNEDDYYNIYFNIKKAEYIRRKKNNTSNEEIVNEKKLLNNIVLTSIEDKDSLDTISLSEDLLKDIKTLKQILNYFSGKECFKEWLVTMNYNNYSNFCYPIWMHNKTELSLCQFISGIFEQQILLSYEYFFYTKKIYFFHNTHLILDIYKDNKNLENFWNQNNDKENIITKEIINEIITKVKSNVNYKKKRDEFNIMIEQLYKDYYKTEFYIGNTTLSDHGEIVYKKLNDEMTKNKTKGKEIISLLNRITFIKLNDVDNFKEYIYINLRKYLIETMEKEIVNELINDTNHNNKGKKKKKKKKKNKNENSNSNDGNIVINNNINNEENKINKNIINENNNDNNFSSNDENDINSNSSKSLKMKDISEIKENIKIKSEKNKNKEFFLFPINNKKNKDKIKNKESNEHSPNEKSLSEKNNIKINYIEKKKEIALKKEENEIIKNISEQYLSKEYKENEKIKTPKKSEINIDQLSETSIRFEMLNSQVNQKKEENKININHYAMNSPESTTSFSFEASTKEKSSIENENLNNDNPNNINANKNPINMTINIINNQYIYQQYPFFNFNFNNFALMQSQFLYYYHVPSDLFFEKLSKEIKEYENLTTKNIEILDKIRRKYFIKVEKMIESGLNKKYEIKFGHYGSHFTNLSIEGSDVDIRVYYKPKKPNLDFLKDIINILNIHLNDFENINPILSASVPVIVLQINISKEINNTILKFLPYFERKDISHINIDLTFTSDEKEFKRPGEIVNYINNNVKNYEDIRPLLLVIKRYFRIMKMNKSFTGGLSSYSLFLLILAFLKNNEEKMNSGKELYYIMEKYSFFDFKNYGIDVEGKEQFFPLNTQDIENIDDNFENERNEEIKILDPLTKLNVAKSSFRLEEIRNTFIKALYFLKFESWKFQSETTDEENAINNNDFTVIKKLFCIK